MIQTCHQGLGSMARALCPVSLPTKIRAVSKSDICAAPWEAEEEEKRRRLAALRKGVKNERGDTVYFLPSFLEDPWKILEEERKPLKLRMGPRGVEYYK